MNDRSVGLLPDDTKENLDAFVFDGQAEEMDLSQDQEGTVPGCLHGNRILPGNMDQTLKSPCQRQEQTVCVRAIHNNYQRNYSKSEEKKQGGKL